VLLTLSAEEAVCIMAEAGVTSDKDNMRAILFDIVSHGHMESGCENEFWVWDSVPRILSRSSHSDG
jgi:hypothetical protein